MKTTAPLYTRVPLGDTTPVESYAQRAIDRWQGRSQRSKRPHGFECPCCTCADGREALGRPALMPLFSRRTIQEGRVTAP